MIFKFLLNGIMTAVLGIIATMQNSIPNMNLLFTDLAQIYLQIIQISQQALNFVHFIVGDSIIWIIPIIPPLLIAKYLILPIVDIARRLVPFVNL